MTYILSAALVLSMLGLMQSLGRGWAIPATACALIMVGALSALTIRTGDDR